MIRNLAKLLAFKKAPIATLALLSPIRFLKWGAAFFVMKKIVEMTRST